MAQTDGGVVSDNTDAIASADVHTGPVDLLEGLSELLADSGINVSAGTLGVILVILAAIIVVRLVIGAVQAAITAGGAVAAYARTQVKNKFWRDSGKLTTLISLVLLVIAYGLFSDDQRRPIGDALLELGRERLLEVLPIAILTQVLLLCGFWLLYGRILRVPGKTLFEPFKNMLFSLLWIVLLSIGSVVMMFVTNYDSEAALVALGVSMMVALLVVVLMLPRMAKLQAPQVQPGVKTRMGPLFWTYLVVAIGLLFSMTGSLFAAIYTGISDDPTVLGLIGFVTIVVAAIMLIACYRFRAFIGKAEVPPATGYLIDFSLAISALAVALISLPGSGISFGSLPAWIVAAAPALLVAVSVFVFNLLRLRGETPRWALCLAVAVVAGLLVGPAKELLTPVLTPIADLFPVPEL